MKRNSCLPEIMVHSWTVFGRCRVRNRCDEKLWSWISAVCWMFWQQSWRTLLFTDLHKKRDVFFLRWMVKYSWISNMWKIGAEFRLAWLQKDRQTTEMSHWRFWVWILCLNRCSPRRILIFSGVLFSTFREWSSVLLLGKSVFRNFSLRRPHISVVYLWSKTMPCIRIRVRWTSHFEASLFWQLGFAWNVLGVATTQVVWGITIASGYSMLQLCKTLFPATCAAGIAAFHRSHFWAGTGWQTHSVPWFSISMVKPLLKSSLCALAALREITQKTRRRKSINCFFHSGYIAFPCISLSFSDI